MRDVAGEWEDLDLSGTGNLYLFVPVVTFQDLTHLNLNSTSVTPPHFQQLTQSMRSQHSLEIADYPQLHQISIPKARTYMNELEYVVISHNPKLTILAVACLCSCTSLQTLIMHVFDLCTDEYLFLTKTLENIARGELELETEDGFPLRLVTDFEAEIF